MLASVGQPSLHGYDACMVYWTKGALRRICRQTQYGETSFFSFQVFFCLVGISRAKWFWDIEVLNVGVLAHSCGLSLGGWC